VTGISSHRNPVEEPGRELMYRRLREMDEGYVEKALDMGISLHTRLGTWKWAYLPSYLRYG
jgi:hypothetical protein